MQNRSHHLARAARPAAAALVALALAASLAGAQYGDRRGGSRGSGRATAVYEWEGRVDREIRLRLRGDRASVDRVGSNESRRGSGRLLATLPREDGTLRVRRLDGRGDIDVIQQPSARNDYTAVVRLRDPANGAATYRVVAYWEPARGSYARGDDRRRGRDERYDGRDGRHDRDDRYERRRRDRRDRDDRDRDDRDRGRRERRWP